MTRTLVIAGVLLAASAVVGVPASARRADLVGRFSARIADITDPSRMTFRRVDIIVKEWSTDLDHRQLARAVQERGPVAVIDLLCGYPSLGSIVIAGDREVTIRYAWQAADREGGERVYLATDEPITLASREFRKTLDLEPFNFVELRLNARGEGTGKLSDVVQLSVDQSRNVIELRDFERRPLHLAMVRDERTLSE